MGWTDGKTTKEEKRAMAIMNTCDLAMARVNEARRWTLEGASKAVEKAGALRYLLALMDESYNHSMNADSDGDAKAREDWRACYIRVRDMRKIVERGNDPWEQKTAASGTN